MSYAFLTYSIVFVGKSFYAKFKNVISYSTHPCSNNILQVYNHEQYNADNVDYDLALVRLWPPVEYR